MLIAVKGQKTVSGWWFEPLLKKYLSIGMIISNIWENNPNVPNHQPVYPDSWHCLCMFLADRGRQKANVASDTQGPMGYQIS